MLRFIFSIFVLIHSPAVSGFDCGGFIDQRAPQNLREAVDRIIPGLLNKLWVSYDVLPTVPPGQGGGYSRRYTPKDIIEKPSPRFATNDYVLKRLSEYGFDIREVILRGSTEDRNYAADHSFFLVKTRGEIFVVDSNYLQLLGNLYYLRVEDLPSAMDQIAVFPLAKLSNWIQELDQQGMARIAAMGASKEEGSIPHNARVFASISQQNRITQLQLVWDIELGFHHYKTKGRSIETFDGHPLVTRQNLEDW